MLRFSASSAARLMACPGSANLEAAIPGWTPPVEDPTKFKAKGLGTQIHEILEPFTRHSVPLLRVTERVLQAFSTLHHTKRKKLLSDETGLETYLGNWTHNPRYQETLKLLLHDITSFTPKVMRFIARCAGFLLELRLASSYQEDVEFLSELEMETCWLKEPGKTTADVVIISESARMIHVVDYKTGSIPVYAVDNDQLLFYARSVLHEYGVDTPQGYNLTLHILQPGNESEWEVTDTEVFAWAEKATEAELRILDGDTTLVPSDHCTFCPANPYARGEKGYPLCPAQRAMLFPEVVDLDEMLN